MNTKHKPATPLPWKWKDTPTSFALGNVGALDALWIEFDPKTTMIVMHQKDSAYIVHACNSYQRLVRLVREIADGRDVLMHEARGLLHELGEDV